MRIAAPVEGGTTRGPRGNMNLMKRYKGVKENAHWKKNGFEE
jgi:hypothetical protein